jgi:hypothetical protein
VDARVFAGTDGAQQRGTVRRSLKGAEDQHVDRVL